MGHYLLDESKSVVVVRAHFLVIADLCERFLLELNSCERILLGQGGRRGSSSGGGLQRISSRLHKDRSSRERWRWIVLVGATGGAYVVRGTGIAVVITSDYVGFDRFGSCTRYGEDVFKCGI